MRKIVPILAFLLALSAFSCRNGKHDAVYYQAKIDSIRKAEQQKELLRNTARNSDPVAAWFDTLTLRPLPLQTQGKDLSKIGHFVPVPRHVNEHFGYSVAANLKALALPSAWHHRVILLCEMQDSVTPVLFLYTMDRRHQPIDLLCIYEQKSEDRVNDFGKSYTEYFITSQYEITLMGYYQSHRRTRRPELEYARRFTINRDGKFEELVVEL